MPDPAVRAVGTYVAGTGAITVVPPAGHVSGDVELLFVDHQGDAGQPTLTTAAGFVAMTGAKINVGGTTPSAATAELTIFWRRWNGTDGSPVVADSGGHTAGIILSFHRVKSTGDPFAAVTTSFETGNTDTTGVIAGGTTTVDRCLIVLGIATSLPDAADAPQLSGWTNANLTSITSWSDNTTNAGSGGGLGTTTGLKETAGAVGNTTVTTTVNTAKAMISLALLPVEGQTVVADLLSQAPSIFNPTVVPPGSSVMAQLLADAISVNPPIISVGDSVVATLLNQAPSLFDPVVSPGGVNVVSQLISQLAQLFDPSILTVSPFFQAAGTPQFGAGSLTVDWPTHLTNDIGLLMINTGGEGTPLDPGSGWVHVPDSPLADVADATGSRLHVLWKRAASAAEGSIATGDSGDHQIARIFTFRGCAPTGDPWNAIASAIKTTASTTATFPTVTTTVDDALVVLIASRPDDSGSNVHFGVAVNSNLTELAEAGENSTSTGHGGGQVLGYGKKAAAGVVGESTMTKIASTTDVTFTIALRPPAAGQSIVAQLLSQAVSLFDPTIGSAVVTNLLSQLTTLFTPEVSPGGVIVEAQLIADNRLIYSPDIKPISLIVTQLIENGVSPFDPTISVGGVVVVAQLINRAGVLFDPTVLPGGVVVQIPFLKRSQYPVTVLALGPSAYWRLGATGLTLEDESTANLDLTVLGSVTSVAGTLTEDADTALIPTTLGDSAERLQSGLFGATAGSLVGWWKAPTSSVSSDHEFLFGGRNETSSDFFFLRMNGTATLEVRVRTNTGQTDVNMNVPLDGGWHLLALTWDGATVTSYLDGVQQAQASRDGTYDGAGNFALWTDPRGDPYDTDDALDEVAVWQRVLTASEIEHLWEARLYGPTSVFKSTISVAGVTVVGQLISQPAVLFDPAISPGGVTVQAMLLTDSPLLYDPQINAVNAVVVGLVDQQGVLYDPTVVPDQFVLANLLSNSPSLFDPEVRTGETIVVPLLDITPIVFDPSISPGAVIVAPEFLDSLNQLFQPTITLGAAGGQTVGVDALTQVTTALSPTISPGSVTVNPASLDSPPSVYSPGITQEQFVQAQIIAQTIQAFSPDIRAISLVIAEQIIDPVTVFTPSAIPGGITVQVSELIVIAQVNNPRIFVGILPTNYQWSAQDDLGNTEDAGPPTGTSDFKKGDDGFTTGQSDLKRSR